MIRKLCIACGKKVIVRLKFCTCGHVFAETLLVGQTKNRLRGSEKRARLVKDIPGNTSRTLKSKVRKYFLLKGKRLTYTKSTKPIEKPRRHLFKKKGLLLLEERRRRINSIFSSPQHQEKMSKVLHLINRKLLVQKLFSSLIKD
ncbi:uncharacterized protein LOC105848242 [Hydra vulgaris]|uniref:uncharacterized protein LOC105848242 n=1 Tax=Hydra vulgaris TaxID=6087 RepID=UPI001F5F1758|nr:uncharacterized protein LOC105848242 [Hydra vulgaris]